MSPVEENSRNIPEDWFSKKFPGKLLTSDVEAPIEVHSLQAGAVGKHPDVTCKKKIRGTFLSTGFQRKFQESCSPMRFLQPLKQA